MAQHPQPPSTNGNSTATADSTDSSSSRESWWDQTMARWYVSRVDILNSPSIRLHGVSPDDELSKRHTCASCIQEMATRLKVQQLVTNTAIIYMHRFYLIHSFTHFDPHWVAPACLFLAAKVEEQPRRLEHVIREAHNLLAPTQSLDVRGAHAREYHEMAEYLVSLENILLQTLGFDIRIDQPHIHIVRHCNSTKTPKEITQLAYFLATNALHLTTFAVQYPPTRIAAVCLMLAGKWMNYEFSSSRDGIPWFHLVDKRLTESDLFVLANEMVDIFTKYSNKLRGKQCLTKCPNMDAGLARNLGYSFMSSPGMELTMDSERVTQSPSTPELSRESPARATPGTTPCYPVDADSAAREAAAQIASASERVSIEFGGQQPRGVNERERDSMDASVAAPVAGSLGSKANSLLHPHARAHGNGVPSLLASTPAAKHAVSLNEYKRRQQQQSSSSPLPPDQPVEQQLNARQTVESELKTKFPPASSSQVKRSDSDRSEGSSQSSPGAALEEKRKKLAVPKAGGLLSAIMNETMARDRSNSKSESVGGGEERGRERGEGASSGAERPTSHRVKRESESSTGRERHLSSSTSASSLKQGPSSSRSEHPAHQHEQPRPSAATSAREPARSGSRPPHSQPQPPPPPHPRSHTTSTSSSSGPERHHVQQSPPDSGLQHEQHHRPHEHHSQPQPYPPQHHMHPAEQALMSNHVDHKPSATHYHRSQSRSPAKDLYSGAHPRSPTKYHPHPEDRPYPPPSAQTYAKRPYPDPRAHFSQPPPYDGGPPGRHYDPYTPLSQPSYDSSGQPDYKRARHALDVPDSSARHDPAYAQHHHPPPPPPSSEHPVRHDPQHHPHELHLHSVSSQSSSSMKSSASVLAPGKRGSPAAAAQPHPSQHTQNKSQKAVKQETPSDIEEGEIASDDEAASDEATVGSSGHHQTQASPSQKQSGASPAASRSGHAPPPDARQHIAPHSGHRSRTTSRTFNSSNENGAGDSFASNAASPAVNNYGGDIVQRAAAALRAQEESEEGELASDEDESSPAKSSGPTSVKNALSPRKPPDSSSQPSSRPNVGREWNAAPPPTRVADVRSQPPQQSRFPSLIPPPHTP